MLIIYSICITIWVASIAPNLVEAQCVNNTLTQVFDRSQYCLHENGDSYLDLIIKYIAQSLGSNSRNITDHISSANTTLTTTQLESQICGSAVDNIKTCMVSNLDPSCDNDAGGFVTAVEGAVENFRKLLCLDDGTFSNNALEYLNHTAVAIRGTFVPVSEGGDACLAGEWAALSQGLIWSDPCVLNEIGDIDDWLDVAEFTANTTKRDISAKYKALLQCFGDFFQQSGCDVDIRKGMVIYFSLGFFPLGVPLKLDDIIGIFEVAQPAGRERATIGCFGDPHCLIYNPDGSFFETCGCSSTNDSDWQTYLVNQYFGVYVIHTQIQGSSATVATAVRVVVNDVTVASDGSITSSVPAATYMAHNSVLGTDWVSNSNGNNGATISEVAAGSNANRQRIVITIQVAMSTILINRNYNTYFLWLRVSESILAHSRGMLVGGCPGCDIDITAANKRRRRQASGCPTSDRIPILEEACQYDIGETGDEEMYLALYGDAESAYTSVEEEDPFSAACKPYVSMVVWITMFSTGISIHMLN